MEGIHQFTLALHRHVGRLEEKHDMAYVNLLFHPVVLSGQDAVFHGLIHKIRGGQIAAVGVEFIAESLRAVKTKLLGGGHFLTVRDKQFQVFFNRLRGRLLGVVFVIKILELTESDGLAPHSHQYRILLPFGLHQRRRTKKKSQR